MNCDFFKLSILSILIPASLYAAQPAADYPYQPVPFTKVKFTDTFWRNRIETNLAVTIPFAFGKCEETRRIDDILSLYDSPVRLDVISAV